MNRPESTTNRFRFAGFTLDVERCTLEAGGEEVTLRPKSFDVLHCLVEHEGRPLGVDELREMVWGDVVVGEDSVRHCIIEIRKALDDAGQQIVRTVPRRGYVLDVPVRAEADDGSTSGRTKRRRRASWPVAAAALLVLAISAAWWFFGEGDPDAPPGGSGSGQAESIAVLRFTDMSPDGDQAYLADGLSEEIMHMLAQSPSLTVIARTSSFAVEGEAIDVIGERLGVSHVLEGSVRRQGEDIRVTAQLIDAKSSRHLWSKTYDRNVDDIFQVQKDIASAVASALEVSLAEAEEFSGVDPRAYERYLEGRYFYTRRADGDRLRAQQRFEEAIEIDPGFAHAWAGLAAAINTRLNDQDVPALTVAEREELQDMQRHAVEQALAFGADLPEAQHRAAQFYFYRGEKARALEHLEIARSLDPDHWLVRSAIANELRKLGRIDESISLTRQDVQRDPLNFVLRVGLVHQLIWAGRFEEAQAQLDRLIEMMPAEMDHSILLSSRLPRLQILRGDFAAAALSAAALPEGPERAQLLALAYYGLGRASDSDAALARLSSASDSDRVSLLLAEAHAFRNEPDAAMNALQSIEFDENCNKEYIAQAIYYSPFLTRLTAVPGWEGFRERVFQAMQDCLVGVTI